MGEKVTLSSSNRIRAGCPCTHITPAVTFSPIAQTATPSPSPE
jgi:hypothetical protein